MPESAVGPRPWRDLASYWIFGLCNNFAYVIMLSAAKDIMAERGNATATLGASEFSDGNERNCNELSTGAVLLADILPTLCIKIIAPFLLMRIPYDFRFAAVFFSMVASFIIVATSQSHAVSLTGVVFASLGAGLGEPTFLSLASHFHPDVISAWSSGTGGAGIFGSLAYALLRDKNFLNISARNTLFIMLIVPAGFALTWIFTRMPSTVHRALPHKPSTWIIPESRAEYGHGYEQLHQDDSELPYCPMSENEGNASEPDDLDFLTKLKATRPLLFRFMLPIAVVYFAEYLINQGLHELIQFDLDWLNTDAQYYWFEVLYQLGVFVSRSSVNLFQIPTLFLPVLAGLQLLNVALFGFEAVYCFIPSIFIVFVLIFYEGLLGGAAYVNTFYRMRQEVDSRHVEFSLGVGTLADSCGIVVSGFVALPLHNWICGLPACK